MTPSALLTGGLDPAAFLSDLEAALDAGDVASLLLRLAPEHPEDAVHRAVDRLRPAVQDRGVAFLLTDRPDLAAATGADGVHLEGEAADAIAARRRLGPDAIVGVGCDLSRHRAMVAGEQSADYVAFGTLDAVDGPDAPGEALIDLLSWWAELMTVPCVAFGRATPDEAGALARAGADFVAVGSGVWDWADGAPAAVRAYNEAFAAAHEDRVRHADERGG